MIENLATGFNICLSFHNIMYCFIGCFLGQVIGVLPGLGPVATIAMLLSLTYKLNLTSAIIMLAGIYYGAQYGGTITSVLFKIPGEVSTVVTTLDGYQMALQGRAGKALGVAAFGSFIAGTFGTAMLSLLAPSLSNLVLIFGPPEYASLMFLGLTLVICMGTGSPLKATMTGLIGLALGTVGVDPVAGIERFTFGSFSFFEGINVAVVAMGLFGIGEILYMAESVTARFSRDAVRCPTQLKELLPNRNDWKDSIMPIGRGTFLGFLLGILPGGGALIASFVSYGLERKLSRHPERFGKGAIEGVAGPESANNSAVSGCFIPLLTLGIPSNVIMALLLAAFMIHGVTPGPLFLKDTPHFFWAIIASMYIGNIILVILNIPLIRVFIKLMEVPTALISPLLIMICAIGAFSINNNLVDILTMIFFGGVGYLMKKLDFELAPLMLAFVLGPMFEKAIRQTLITSQGNPMVFLTRPICRVLIGFALIMIISPLLMRIIRSLVRRHSSN
jgi:putative tricarboxylic transport membrane protein